MLHGFFGVLGRYLVGNQDVVRRVVFLQITDDSLEVLGLGITRTANVEFLLYEKLRGEADVLLGIADANHATREGYLVDCHLIGHRGTHSLDDHVGTGTTRNFLQTLVHILLGAVDGVFSAQPTDDGQFLVVHIAGNDLGTTHDGAHHGTYTHHATANDHDGVGVNHLRTTHGMETDGHRLNQGSVLDGNRTDGDDFLPGNGDVFAHGTVALHAQRLVVLAGVVAAVLARRTVAAVGIGVHRDGHSRT